jgi:copper chaperone NosL
VTSLRREAVDAADWGLSMQSLLMNLNQIFKVTIVVVLSGLALLPLAFAGEDRSRKACDYCRMIISDKQYGGKLRTAKGKTYIFDASECLAAFTIKQMAKPDTVATMSSVNFDNPASFVNVNRAIYLQTKALMSPMSLNLLAFATAADAEAARKKHPGEILRWNQVLEMVKRKWFPEMLAK